jgi:hypothetical protein
MKVRDITDEFNIKVLPAVGGGKTKVPGTVVNLVQRVPALIQDGYLPPLKLLNGLFAKGRSENGMGGGCEWEPFQITSEAFHQRNTSG